MGSADGRADGFRNRGQGLGVVDNEIRLCRSAVLVLRRFVVDNQLAQFAFGAVDDDLRKIDIVPVVKKINRIACRSIWTTPA